jgi:ABC-type antimicrobial peptide transport system permease subunit
MWPGEDPIGKRFACCEGSESEPVYKTVVGVIPDFHSRGPTLPAEAEFYIPLQQAPPDSWNWIDRTLTVVATGRSDAHAIAAQINDAVHSTDPNIPVYGISSVAHDLELSTASERFNATLLSMLGALGLVLAAIGIYGVVSYFVNLKTKEIGVRIALGATTGSVLGLMIRQAMVPVAIGLVVGVAAALMATRVLASSLFGITPTDPVTFASVIGTLTLVSLIAFAVPARRASKVAPSQALIG